MARANQHIIAPIGDIMARANEPIGDIMAGANQPIKEPIGDVMARAKQPIADIMARENQVVPMPMHPGHITSLDKLQHGYRDPPIWFTNFMLTIFTVVSVAAILFLCCVGYKLGRDFVKWSFRYCTKWFCTLSGGVASCIGNVGR